ncbi:LON peptidase substrate-binding domain-containing protein [Kineococcus gynurae]|uniref:LON peptidase substrate-binding domain-containing protein n=1 Tax=Kineococcus gynurae TaxID=452979 RepID=A0ABV5LXV1_9ACTN
MPRRLPLFPLNSVLFPGLVLPLTVFEPRYRTLVADLMAREDTEARGFGVVAIRSGHEVGPGNTRMLHEVGCLALLREVSESPDGTIEIVTVGASRFRLLGIDTEAGTPYLTGLVEAYGRDDATDDATDGADAPPLGSSGAGNDALPSAEAADLAVLAAGVAGRFENYRERLGIGGTSAPDDPEVLSFLVAAAMVLPLGERQRLLEALDTRDRLVAEETLLRNETALIDTFGTLPTTQPVDPGNPN